MSNETVIKCYCYNCNNQLNLTRDGWSAIICPLCKVEITREMVGLNSYDDEGSLPDWWLQEWHPLQLPHMEQMICELFDGDAATLDSHGKIRVRNGDEWRTLTGRECYDFRAMCEEEGEFTEPPLDFDNAGKVSEEWMRAATWAALMDMHVLAERVFNVNRAWLYNNGAVKVQAEGAVRLLNQEDCDRLVVEYKEARKRCA